MQLRRLAAVVIAFATVLTLISIQARAASSDEGKTSTYISREVTVGSTKLSPGQYNIKADASHVTFALESNGRVVAQAPIQWKDESSKPTSSNVEYSDDKVVAIHFKGKSRYAALSE